MPLLSLLLNPFLVLTQSLISSYLQDEESTSDGDACLCGTCDETNTCVNELSGSRPIYFAIKYTGTGDAPSAISVQVKGKAGCQFLDIRPHPVGNEIVYFVDIGSTCGTGGDFKVYEGDVISGEMIGYIHISCSESLYIGLAFEDQDSGFGPFTLVGSCFSTSKKDVQTPSCLEQCDGIIKQGDCTDETTADSIVASLVAPWASNKKNKNGKNRRHY